VETGPTARIPYQKLSFIFFLLAWAFNEAMLFLGDDRRGGAGWPESLLLIAATISTLVTLARRLPTQNVVMTAVLIVLLSSLIVTIGTVTGIPFGPYSYTEQMGDRIFSILPWTMPVLWIVLIINARGVARLVMRPWRQTKYYGFWVIGLAAAGAVLFDLSLEPFATTVKNYWGWQAPGWVWTWYSAPWINFLSWFFTSILILLLSTPWLINKQPIKQPMDYHPFVTVEPGESLAHYRKCPAPMLARHGGGAYR